ncbi:MAG: polysaccharide deacetylase family protein [Armatimonadetes bacterium]|nr:polysaccharide deacetylase family protein [Armatimonadota bacterium]
MNISLKVGLFPNNPGWEIILNQEGISYEIISENSDLTPENFAVIILSNMILGKEKSKILSYLQNEGSILFDAKCYADFFKIKIKTKKADFLNPDETSIFSNSGLVDIYSKIYKLNSDNLDLLDQGLQIQQRKAGKGNILVLPFDVNNLMLDTHSVRRKFYFQRKELPSEIVVKIAKSPIRRIVKTSLEYLFHLRNLPFVQMWYYPDGYKNVFLFRIDTDFCSKEDAEELYEICEKNQIKATWFADTNSQKLDAEPYINMKNQEIALHCVRHRVFNDYQQNYDNLSEGKKKLEKTKFSPTGFASPFGEWNPQLGKVIEDLDFKYSSEFGLNYDDFPYFPFYDGEKTDILQIPIHPISVGRLRRSHFSDAEMLRYYLNLINKKSQRNEPIIFYHHPHQKRFEIFDEIFKEINRHKIWKPNFSEFSNWWKKRNKIQPDFTLKDNKLISNIKNLDEKIYLKISTKDGFTITKIKEEIELKKLNWEQKERMKLPKDIWRIRKKHWRDLLYDLESKRGKAKL